jgi:hypothetical protein
VNYGGDSGNTIFVLYWRCPLITVSVIRGSSVLRIQSSGGVKACGLTDGYKLFGGPNFLRLQVSLLASIHIQCTYQNAGNHLL